MIPDALVSCGYLLLGSGYCIHRLIKHSNDTFTKLLPEFIIASIGVAAIGGRSLHALVYNLFWRSYPIDPRLIAKELRRSKDDKNIVDWLLRRIGVASLVYSFYHQYGLGTVGKLIVVVITAIEVLRLKEEVAADDETNRGERVRRWKKMPYPVATFWILSSEFFGRAVGNHYCRVANVPLLISIWAFPSQGFYKGWSIEDSINDYMMLCYAILMTEGLCQTLIVD